MTNRERMLAAYKREQPDQVPVSPELWYDVAADIDKGCTWQDICFGAYPLWKAQLTAHRYFGSAAWLIAAPRGGHGECDIIRRAYYTARGDLEFHYMGRCSKGALEWRIRNNSSFYGWMSEHPVKSLEKDLEVFELLFMPEPAAVDLSEIAEAVEGAQQDGIVTAYVGALFFSFIASHIEGGAGAAILALIDEEARFKELQERYIAWLTALATRIADECDTEILLVDNGYSTAGIINPGMYEKWDLPVVRAVSDAVHKSGKLLHLHQHGKCMPLMDMILSGGPDLVDPFERPPSGDTHDLAFIKREYGQRIAIRGNMHAHNTLLRGTAADVDREARECIEAAADGGGFILASGDGVILGTPFQNIFAMVAAGEKYGRYQRS